MLHCGRLDWIRNFENGFLIPPGSPQTIAEKIIQLINELEMRIQIEKETVV
jgi:glycosyltransferase involved in cell wall biosynthesis